MKFDMAWPVIFSVLILTLIQGTLGTEFGGGINAMATDSNSLLGGIFSSGPQGATSMAFINDGSDLSKNYQVNGVQVLGTINVLRGGSIQNAVKIASLGDTIKVGPGLFKENINIDKSLTIKGNGAGSNSFSNTIIDGQKKGSVVIVQPGVVSTISDLTITNGNALVGGGILNQGDLTLSDCIIKGNNAGLGGGIYNLAILDRTVVARITSCTISSNTAAQGAGIYNAGLPLSSAIATITNSEISYNTASLDGGGVYSMNGALTLGGKDVIKNNKALGSLSDTGYGGGIFIQGGSTQFGGTTTISYNQAKRPSSEANWYTGWGVYNDKGSSIINYYAPTWNPAKQVHHNAKLR